MTVAHAGPLPSEQRDRARRVEPDPIRVERAVDEDRLGDLAEVVDQGVEDPDEHGGRSPGVGAVDRVADQPTGQSLVDDPTERAGVGRQRAVLDRSAVEGIERRGQRHEQGLGPHRMPGRGRRRLGPQVHHDGLVAVVGPSGRDDPGRGSDTGQPQEPVGLVEQGHRSGTVLMQDGHVGSRFGGPQQRHVAIDGDRGEVGRVEAEPVEGRPHPRPERASAVRRHDQPAVTGMRVRWRAAWVTSTNEPSRWLTRAWVTSTRA